MTDHNPTGNEPHGLTVGQIRKLTENVPPDTLVWLLIGDENLAHTVDYLSVEQRAYAATKRVVRCVVLHATGSDHG